MATLNEVTKIMGVMAMAYPRYELRPETIKIYARLLEDVPVKTLEVAAEQLMATSTFFPALAELRNAALDIATKKITKPTAFEAWGEVMEAVRRVGYYHPAPEFSHPAIGKTVQIFGWQNLCMSENVDYDRAHFVRAYEAIASRDEQVTKLLPATVDLLAIDAGQPVNVGDYFAELKKRIALNGGGS